MPFNPPDDPFTPRMDTGDDGLDYMSYKGRGGGGDRGIGGPIGPGPGGGGEAFGFFGGPGIGAERNPYVRRRLTAPRAGGASLGLQKPMATPVGGGFAPQTPPAPGGWGGRLA